MQSSRLRARYRYICGFCQGDCQPGSLGDHPATDRSERPDSRTRPARSRQIAIQFRVLALRMGGVMIKVGQFLSAASMFYRRRSPMNFRFAR